jgi:hypothetical protein
VLSARKIVPNYLADPGILYVKPQQDRCRFMEEWWLVGYE